MSGRYTGLLIARLHNLEKSKLKQMPLPSENVRLPLCCWINNFCKFGHCLSTSIMTAEWSISHTHWIISRCFIQKPHDPDRKKKAHFRSHHFKMRERESRALKWGGRRIIPPMKKCSELSHPAVLRREKQPPESNAIGWKNVDFKTKM